MPMLVSMIVSVSIAALLRVGSSRGGVVGGCRHTDLQGLNTESGLLRPEARPGDYLRPARPEDKA